MTKEEIIDKLKEFCVHEFWAVEHLNYNIHDAITRCYGVVMFVINMNDFDKNLEYWWNHVMLPRFRELERR